MSEGVSYVLSVCALFTPLLHPYTTADDPTDAAQGENPEAEDAIPDRKRGRPCGRGDDAPKRFWEVGEDG